MTGGQGAWRSLHHTGANQKGIDAKNSQPPDLTQGHGVISRAFCKDDPDNYMERKFKGKQDYGKESRKKCSKLREQSRKRMAV